MKNQEAIANYNQAFKLKPDYGNAYYNRGLAKSKLKDNQGVDQFNGLTGNCTQNGKLR